MTFVRPRRLAPDLWLLDTCYRDTEGVIASYLLEGPDGAALVDVGSAVTMERVLAGIQDAGVARDAITHILLTHMHLDHAGAAGALLRYLPQATIYAHERGATHLIDPSRLIRSASRIYGDQMGALWGQIEPVPAERLRALTDGDTVKVGDRSLRALYTPGHAVHHVVFHDAGSGEIFAGDVAGVRLEGSRFVRPPTPPPDLNLEDWNASLDLIESLSPNRLYLPHFGQVDDISAHIAKLRERLEAWGEIALAKMRVGASDETIAQALAASDSEDAAMGDAVNARRYEIASNYLMSAQGYVRYYQTAHPERLTT